MRYPKPLNPLTHNQGARIAITAPSSGVNPPHHARLDLAINNLRELGFQPVEGRCLRSNEKHVSASKEHRAAEFMEFYLDESIGAIFPPWGGEFLIDILPLLDFDQLKNAPAKWVVGYSDTSTLLLPLTTRLNMATLHGTNLMDSIPAQKDPLSAAIFSAMALFSGDLLTQASSEKYQTQWTDFVKHPESPFQLNEPTSWKRLNFTGDVRFSGRMIGGCLDCVSMLTGTAYGDVPGFCGSYRADGSIIYLENCELNPLNLYRTLYNLKLAGWFNHANGVLFGRSTGPDQTEAGKITYIEVLQQVFRDVEYPVLYDVDIGHQPPQLAIINGSMGLIKFENDRAEFIQNLI